MQYAIYLRKSRADIEAEAHGEGETLLRHEKALLDLAKRQKLNVTEIYREVVSGETISARPMMQKLLEEVEQGIWSGVLVMEVERLARGDTIDQGIVSQAFKYTGTKIITPMNVYDTSNEYDEEIIEIVQNTKEVDLDHGDVLLEDAIRLVVEDGQASISMLQRRLRIGYARAARIIDEMELRGIVGGHEGSKPRKVLISQEDLRNIEEF